MKSKSFVAIAAMVALMGISHAEEAKAEKKGKKEISPELLEKYDADKDGKLSKDERAVMKKDKGAKPEKKGKGKGGKKAAE